MKITVGHTPDSDDAFMFYGMLEGKIPSPDFQIEHVIGDIEELNKRALNNELDVTAVSIHACAYMPDYVMLRSGGSFGIGYGPIITAKLDISRSILFMKKTGFTQRSPNCIRVKSPSVSLCLQLHHIRRLPHLLHEGFELLCQKNQRVLAYLSCL